MRFSEAMSDTLVVVLGTNFASRHAGRLFHEFGADVVRISMLIGGLQPVDTYLDEGVHSGTLGARATEATLPAVVAVADVCVVDEQLLWLRGTLNSEPPRAVHGRRSVVWLTSLGIEGPDGGARGTSATLWARAGALAGNGRADREPLPLPGDVPHSAAAMLGVIAAAGHALANAGTPAIAEFDISAYEAALFCQDFGTTEVQYSGANLRVRQGNMWPVVVLNCADLPVALIVTNEDEWQRFCVMVERVDLQQRPEFSSQASRKQNSAALMAEISPWFSDKNSSEALSTAITWRIALSPVLRPQDIRKLGQLSSRNVFHDWEPAWTPHLAEESDGLPQARGGADDKHRQLRAIVANSAGVFVDAQ